MQQALPAIILAALRRFRGPAVFRGLRPSSSPGAPFWPSGLTLRSSGPAFCGPLTLAVRAHTKMPRWLKRLLVGSAKIIVALVVVFGLLLGYGSYAEQSATRKASAMCSSIHIGDSTEDLRPRAIADGASEFQSRWFKADGVDMLYITYVGLPPFSRHMCVVRAQGGRVLSAKESYLD